MSGGRVLLAVLPAINTTQDPRWDRRWAGGTSAHELQKILDRMADPCNRQKDDFRLIYRGAAVRLPQAGTAGAGLHRQRPVRGDGA